ncbi:YraN family protein [Thermomonas mangrovi]|uniref:YraN family protein n=1 Tax=Thermomonas mangrovi TaxID=2993316 RepID=UPI0023074607|nr:YraN family protein [Thermomonas mangrovi]
MPDARRARGDAAEAAALAMLQARGLQLLARNAASRGGELDLVMRDGATVVFVEVRYRATRRFGGGAASVDAGKRRRLVHAARAFLSGHPQMADAPCRFDVVDADGDPDAPTLTWLRAAFDAAD